MSVDSSTAQPITIQVDGEPVTCFASDSIAAAMIRGGQLTFLQAIDGSSRGFFCGAGLCQQCLVTVDGRPGQRACMVRALDGMTIGRQSNRYTLDTQNAVAVAPNQPTPLITEPQVLVVGGGPAGLFAATIAAELGAQVVLLDEHLLPGGLYFRQAASQAKILPSLSRDRQFARGQQLIDRASRAGVTIHTNARVLAGFTNKVLTVLDGCELRIFRPQYLVVASGSYESAPPFPGWTLPGVMTSGAAQGLLRGHGVIPGRRMLIVGNGPYNFQVARELHRAGAEIAAVMELAPIFRPASALPLFRMFLAAPLLTLEHLYSLLELRVAGIPVHSGSAPTSIDAVENQLRITFGRNHPDSLAVHGKIDVDIVCLGFASLPSNELLRLLGCRHRYDARLGMLRPIRDPDCQTSIDNIFGIGDCCGVRGAPIAMQEGTIVATRIAALLGLSLTRSALRRVRKARQKLRRQCTFQAALSSLYRTVNGTYDLAKAETPVCRCEIVSYAKLEAALADGYSSLAEIKRCTRLGMGMCQGRYCAPLLLSHLVKIGALEADEYSLIAPPVPITPVHLHELLMPGAHPD